MMRLFDTHCHLTDERFEGDVCQVLTNMKDAKVDRFMLASSDMASSLENMDFSQRYPGAYCAVGVHPHESKDFKPDDIETLRTMLKKPKVQALGEIGLDYFYDFSPKDTQKDVFLHQMFLAKQENKPMIIHVRDAHGDLLSLLHAHKNELPDGIIHCYSGSWESAKEYLSLGFYISFAGPVTFKKAPNLQEVAKNVPKDRILVETDSPYLAPEPVRGHRNEPANVRYVLEKIAALREINPEAMAEITYQNALRIYRIPDEPLA